MNSIPRTSKERIICKMVFTELNNWVYATSKIGAKFSEFYSFD